MESTQHSTGPLDLRPTRPVLDLRPTGPVLDLREWTDEQWQEWSKWQEWSEQPQEPKVVPATVPQPQQSSDTPKVVPATRPQPQQQSSHCSHTPKVVPATRPQPQQQSGQHEPKVVIDLTSSEEFVSKMPQQCEMSQSVPLSAAISAAGAAKGCRSFAGSTTAAGALAGRADSGACSLPTAGTSSSSGNPGGSGGGSPGGSGSPGPGGGGSPGGRLAGSGSHKASATRPQPQGLNPAPAQAVRQPVAVAATSLGEAPEERYPPSYILRGMQYFQGLSGGAQMSESRVRMVLEETTSSP